MKRRFYALMLVVAMLAMTLVGCGSDTNGKTDVESATNTTNTTNTTNDTEVNTEVDESGDDVVVEPTEEPIEEPTTEPEVEEPVVEPTPEEIVDGENDKPLFAYSSTFVFPDDMEGFTKKFLNEDYPEWSINETHAIPSNGYETNFTWEGPAELGSNASIVNSTIFLEDSNRTYQLRVWGCDVTGVEDYLRNYDKDTIVSWDAPATNYVSGDYYEFNDGNINARVTFKVTATIDDNDYTGYACYFENYETMICYQTTYLERNDVFNDSRALAVVNSIDFWQYEE